jgi:hypothetical protein
MKGYYEKKSTNKKPKMSLIPGKLTSFQVKTWRCLERNRNPKVGLLEAETKLLK